MFAFIIKKGTDPRLKYIKSKDRYETGTKSRTPRYPCLGQSCQPGLAFHFWSRGPLGPAVPAARTSRGLRYWCWRFWGGSTLRGWTVPLLAASFPLAPRGFSLTSTITHFKTENGNQLQENRNTAGKRPECVGGQRPVCSPGAGAWPGHGHPPGAVALQVAPGRAAETVQADNGQMGGVLVAVLWLPDRHRCSAGSREQQ